MGNIQSLNLHFAHLQIHRTAGYAILMALTLELIFN